MDGDDGDLDDDDMMDKISSSPSIDDGGSPTCHLPPSQSLHNCASPCSSPASACFSEARSSSPYLDQPDYLPLQLAHQDADKSPAVLSRGRHHHLPGTPPGHPDARAGDENMASGDSGQENARSSGLLHEMDPDLPVTDDGTRNDLDDLLDGIQALKQDFEAEQGGIDEAIGMEDEVCSSDDLTVPYEGSTDDDDDDDDDNFLQSNDPRFIDSGWGGECLHDTEDIDFELVYALHTFIATVEGQANATKGDAMVLLDDSNSYWWLVRVVKDSSIGMRAPRDVCPLA